VMHKERVYLVQTDTTVGWVSRSAKRLAQIKKRPLSQPFLTAVADLRSVASLGRVPGPFRAMVRRAGRTSFVLPSGASFRLVKGPHAKLIKETGPLYTTSANLHGKAFDEQIARERADVWVEDARGYREAVPSAIWRLGRKKKRRLR